MAAPLSAISTYPLSPFQDRIALFPVTCKISKAAFAKLKEAIHFQICVGMGLGTDREIRLFSVDNSLYLRLSCYQFPLFSPWDTTVTEHVAPALCRGFDKECAELALRRPKWFSLSTERTILCNYNIEVKNLQTMNASLRCSGKEIFFKPLPPQKEWDRDTLILHLDFKDDEWDLKSQFQEAKAVCKKPEETKL